MSTPASPHIARLLALLAIVAALAVWQRPPGTLQIFFPTLKGDAAIIQLPGGETILLDGGGDPAALLTALGRHMPFWQRSLAAVIASDDDSDRLPGQVAALARYCPRASYVAVASRRGAQAREHERLLGVCGKPARQLSAGMVLRFGAVSLAVLGFAADGGAILRLTYGARSVVFAQASASEELARAAQTDLLVFPWDRDPHTPLVLALRPRAMLLTDGTSLDHPARLTYLDRAVGGARLYHERIDGDLTYISDGRSWKIVTAPSARP